MNGSDSDPYMWMLCELSGPRINMEHLWAKLRYHIEMGVPMQADVYQGCKQTSVDTTEGTAVHWDMSDYRVSAVNT